MLTGGNAGGGDNTLKPKNMMDLLVGGGNDDQNEKRKESNHFNPANLPELEVLSVLQEISLETLKNSTIQFYLKVDMNYSEEMTEKILNKLR